MVQVASIQTRPGHRRPPKASAQLNLERKKMKREGPSHLPPASDSAIEDEPFPIYSMGSFGEAPVPKPVREPHQMQRQRESLLALNGSQTRLSQTGSISVKNGEASWRHWDRDLVLKQTREFDANFASIETRIHRFPPSLTRLRQQYGAPVDVPIGPYHGILQDFTMGTIVKNVATYHYQLDTTFGSFDDMYVAFCSTLGDVRRFCDHVPYDDDTLKFNMLRDGCFLLQYMDMCTTGRDKMPPSLVCYFESNQVVIDREIMLLENQLPWVVIQTLRSYKKEPVQVEQFIAKMARTFQVSKGMDDKPLDFDGSYAPPHLLGLLRFCKIDVQNLGDHENQKFSVTNYCCYRRSGGLPQYEGMRSMSKTISAIHLAEIGIKLRPSKTTNFLDIDVKKRLFSCEIVLPPLLLDETRLCWLINMVAFELCVAATLRDTEKNAVCSYLFVLAMLMDREEDVHRLRSKGIVHGELTNKETLDFFKGLVKHISGGSLYLHLMEEIEDYKLKRWIWINIHKFFYKNYKTIATVLSVIGVLVGIFKTLFSLRKH